MSSLLTPLLMPWSRLSTRLSLRTRQANTSPATISIPLAFLLVAGALWGVKGVSLLLSLLTVKESLMNVFKELGYDNTYASTMMTVIVFILIFQQILSRKFEFQVGKLPKIYSLIIFAVVVSIASTVPVEGLSVLYRVLASIALAPFVMLISKLQSLPKTVVTLATIFGLLIATPLVTRTISRLPYNMYMCGLIGAGFGVGVTLLMMPFTVAAIQMLKTYMTASGAESPEATAFMIFIGMILFAIVVNEAFERLRKIDIEYMMYLPGIVAILIYVKKAMAGSAPPGVAEATWSNLVTMLDFTILAFVVAGIALLYYAIFTKSKNLYTVSNAYIAGLLVALTTIPEILSQVGS